MGAMNAPGRRNRSRLVAAVALVALSGLVVSCGDDDGSDDAATTTTAPPTTSDTSVDADVEEAILEGYAAAWDATISASSANPVDQSSAALVSTLGGAALSGFEETLSGMAERGEHYLTLAIDTDPEVVEVDGDEAVVVDCVAERSTVVSNADGAVVREADTVHSVRVVMELQEGTWIRVNLTSEQDPSCVE
jgi:hypothetical protein